MQVRLHKEDSSMTIGIDPSKPLGSSQQNPRSS
jgi:hypothetical protein